ncbi:MAG TPA: hypothetical protein VGR71_13775 [Nitrospira sp.]|nr:hypothetical protein [Nitrospira sp.]
MGKDITTLGVLYDDRSSDMALLWTGATGRYSVLHEDELYYDQHMYLKCAYGELSINDAAAALIVFGGNNPTVLGDNGSDSFQGPFWQLTNAVPGTYFDFDLSTWGWWHRSNSLMLVHTQRRPEIRLSFRDLFLTTWNNTLASQLPAEASQDGDPLFSWDPFPKWNVGGSLSQFKIYLTIHQKFVVSIPDWPSDYQATLTYWIEVNRSSTGQLSGFVRRTWVWVEAGTIHEVVAAIMVPNAKLGAITLSNEIQAALNKIGPVNDIYFLPSRQLKWVPNGEYGVFMWHAVNDVTVVIET